MSEVNLNLAVGWLLIRGQWSPVCEDTDMQRCCARLMDLSRQQGAERMMALPAGTHPAQSQPVPQLTEPEGPANWPRPLPDGDYFGWVFDEVSRRWEWLNSGSDPVEVIREADRLALQRFPGRGQYTTHCVPRAMAPGGTLDAYMSQLG